MKLNAVRCDPYCLGTGSSSGSSSSLTLRVVTTSVTAGRLVSDSYDYLDVAFYYQGPTRFAPSATRSC